MTLFLNDVDVRTLGIRCRVPDGWGDGPPRTEQTIQIPGQAGVLLLTSEAELGSRTMTLTGVVLQATAALKRTAWDNFKALLANPVLEVVFDEWPDRMAFARYASVTLAPLTDGMRGDAFTVTLVAFNAYTVARAPALYAIQPTVTAALALGTAPTALNVNLIGNGNANPTITYTDAQGEVKGLLRFLLTLPAGEWIEWRGLSQSADWHRIGGSKVNALPFMDADVVLPLVADPLDSDGTVGPSVSCANCNAVVSVRKAWQ